jgi:ferredoxin, 2Fe-2S
MTSPSIHFLPLDHSYAFNSEESVLEVALKNGVEISHSCGGMGSCTTCRIFVIGAREPLPPRTEVEQEIIDGRGFAANERLSCQLPPRDGLVVQIPDSLGPVAK